MRGGASAHGKTFADATMNRTNQIETFSCRRTNFAETSTANEGWPGPGSQGSSVPYLEPTQIRTKLVDSLSPIGRPALSNLRISC